MVIQLRLTLLSAPCLVICLLMGGPFLGLVPLATAQDYYDDDYDSGSSSRGSLDAADVYTDPVLAIFRNMDLGPLLSRDSAFEVRKGPALEAEAREVLSAGNHALACQLVYAHIAAEYDEAQPSLSQVKFSKLLKRPVWNLRWAVSMAVRGGDDVEEPSPIAIGSSTGDGSEDLYADDDFGGRTGLDEESQNQDSVPPMLNADANDQMNKYLGGVATACAAEFGKRFSAGDFGSLHQPKPESPPGESPPGESVPVESTAIESTRAEAKGISQSAIELLRQASPATPMWRPGIVFLGTGPSSEMIENAKAEHIDMLIHFDVVLKTQGRATQTYTQNVSRVRLIHVAKGKSLIVSKAIDSLEVRKLQSSDRFSGTRRYIDEQMSAFWRTVDREVKLTEMPKLSPESARRRIGGLVRSGGNHKLRALAEVRLYQSQRLIESGDAENAYAMIGSPNALTMMYGPREKAIRDGSRMVDRSGHGTRRVSGLDRPKLGQSCWQGRLVLLAAFRYSPRPKCCRNRVDFQSDRQFFTSKSFVDGTKGDRDSGVD